MSLQFLHAHDCKEKHNDAVWGAQWTAKDQVISISADGSVKQWDCSSGQTIQERPAHPRGITSLSVSPSGEQVLYNSLEGLTSLWDLTSGEVVGTHESFVRTAGEQTEPAWSVSLHPNGETFATTGGLGCVSIRSAQKDNFGQHLSKLESGRVKFGMCVSYSPDGSRVAFSSESGQIYIFDLTSNALTATYTSHAVTVRSFAWSADSQLLLSGSDDKRLMLHDVRVSPSGKPGSGAVASLVGHSSWVLSTSISPDGKLALSGSADRTVKVWDLAARAAVSTISHPNEVWAVSWRPQVTAGSNGSFVTGADDGVLRWWRGAGAA